MTTATPLRFKEHNGSSEDSSRKRKREDECQDGNCSHAHPHYHRRRRRHHHGHHRHATPGYHSTTPPVTSQEGEDELQEGDGDLESFTAHPFARPVDRHFLDPSMSPSGADSTGAATRASHRKKRHSGNRREERRGERRRDYEGFQEDEEEDAREDPDSAFRTSLFDALADDEGSAAYWEGVYSQPIHIFPRPARPRSRNNNAADGHEDDGAETLELMSDDEYAEYVKRKMWERTHPELVREMKLREEQEQKKRRRKEGREREGRDDGRGHADAGFRGQIDEALRRGEARRERKRWARAWERYVLAWEGLKDGMLDSTGEKRLEERIPWPTESGDVKSLTRESVVGFFSNAPSGAEKDEEDGRESKERDRLALLKAERVRWHPDKIQHRFGGNVDAETLKRVTGVFQTIDEMVVAERKKAGKG